MPKSDARAANKKARPDKGPGIHPLTGNNAEVSDKNSDELITGRTSVQFETAFQRLKERKEVHGAVSALRAHGQDGRFKGLFRFLSHWRAKVKSHKRGQRKTPTASETCVHQLLNLGVDLEMAVQKTAVQVPFAKHFKRLKEHEEVHGTVAVLAKHCSKGKFQGLNDILHRWCKKVRCFDQNILIGFMKQEDMSITAGSASS